MTNLQSELDALPEYPDAQIVTAETFYRQMSAAYSQRLALLRKAAEKVCEAHFMTGPRIENTHQRMRELRKVLAATEPPR